MNDTDIAEWRHIERDSNGEKLLSRCRAVVRECSLERQTENRVKNGVLTVLDRLAS